MIKVAWVFPGQGAQAAGMGKDLFACSPAARAVFERADAALCTGEPGPALSQLCFEGPLAELTLTANAQPAIVATSMAILAALREQCGSAEPDCAAGHSLGEYSALCAAGAIELEDAMAICRARGRAMQRAVPPGQGAMAAVMALADDALLTICAEVSSGGDGLVSPANFNAPGQTVIAGTAAAVARAGALAKEQGAKVIPLKVSAPFHCALMQPAERAVQQAVARAALRRPRFDVLANVDAEPKSTEQEIREALVRQVVSPVQWVKTIERMRARGVSHFVEIGPGKVLGGLIKRIDKSLQTIHLSCAADIDKESDLLQSAR